MKERKIRTPEVTDVTDNVAGLFTFGFSYIKNATDKVCDAVGQGFHQAKADAQETKDFRQMDRLVRNQIEIDYKKQVLAQMEELKGRYNA